MPRKAALLCIILHAVWMPYSLVFAQQTRSLTDRAYKDGILQKIASLLETNYVLAEKAKGFADEFKAKCASGAYDSCTEAKEFAAKVTADLVAITRDKHLNFRVIEPSDVGEKAEGTLHHPVRYFRLRTKENAGFYELKWIEPRIGYVDLRRFYSFGEAKDLAVAAMKFLANARAIIIDVRENGGGSEDYLSSCFLPYPTQLSGSYSRQDGVLTEIWTRRDIGVAPRTDVPLFILTGPNTFSAAEYFAYDMKTRKRATIVGEPTKGGAHSVDLFGIDDQFEFYISTARAVSPVTGGNWEGTGVIPDIRVPSAEALDAAVAEAKKAAEEYGRTEDARLKKAVEEMQTHADNAARLYREGKKESADAALDSLFKIASQAGLVSEFFFDVFAYNFQSAPDEQMLFAILAKSIEFFPDSPSAFERLASVHYAKGNKELALQYFRKVLEFDPDNRNAAKMIKDFAFSEGIQTETVKPAPRQRVEIRDTEMRFLESKHAGQTYEIDISFPKDYDKETARYPVLYVLDAEYNFGCVAYIVRRLIKNGDIPKVLVVGIAYNTMEDDFYLKREHDCTPPSPLHGPRSGGAENFVRFFEQELIPYVNRNFRTDPGDRTIVGHSIGGFFGSYVLFKHPGLFAKYLIVSPSLWYADGAIFEYEKEFAGTHQPLSASVFLSTGKDESEQMIRTTEKMIRTMSERRYPGLRFASLMPEGEHHRSVFPYAFTKGVRWLYGPSR